MFRPKIETYRPSFKYSLSLTDLLLWYGFFRHLQLMDTARNLEHYGDQFDLAAIATLHTPFYAAQAAAQMYEGRAVLFDERAAILEAAAYTTDANGKQHVDYGLLAIASAYRLKAAGIYSLVPVYRLLLSEHDEGDEYHSGQDANREAFLR